MSDDLDYIRKFYGVPARRGARIRFRGVDSVIIGTLGQYLRIRTCFNEKLTIHPTWEVEYEPDAKRLSAELNLTALDRVVTNG